MPKVQHTAEDAMMNAATKVALTPTVARAYFNHEACTHASTPAARAKCRKAGPAAQFRLDAGITHLVPQVKATDAADTKVKKAKKAKVAEGPAEELMAALAEAVTEAKAKKVKKTKATVAYHDAVHSHTSDTVIHWANAEGQPACGNKLSQPVAVRVTEAKSCVKCRTMTPPIV